MIAFVLNRERGSFAFQSLIYLLLASLIVSIPAAYSQANISKFPVNGADHVNPDTRLILTFSEQPLLNNSGTVRVYDASNNELVDMLDMSIPPGPKNTRTLAPYDSFVYPSIPDKLYTVSEPDTNRNHVYQKNYIGGVTEADAYHFYPIIIHGNTATIHLHNNKLRYNKRYYVQIDKEVFFLKNSEFRGISGKEEWVFSTKKEAPSLNLNRFVVSTDGSGDFSTVQGAIDFIPENNEERKIIFIKNGMYEEIVYFRNKKNVTFLGEDREQVIIAYANNGVFNTRIMSPDPALAQGSHNIRAVFAVDKSKGIHIVNLTLRSIGEKPAQAEALLILGDEHIVDNVNIEGSGDALQATGNIYVRNTKIQGFGDNVLGYGAVFFENCEFVSFYGPHLWVRNPEGKRGNVLLNCTLRSINGAETVIARAPDSRGRKYPYCEAVLINCKLHGIRPEGWGKVTDVTDHIKYWEYNSTDLETGEPIDASKRHPVSRQLTLDKDSEIIKNYMNPAFVLNGWTPRLDLPYFNR